MLVEAVVAQGSDSDFYRRGCRFMFHSWGLDYFHFPAVVKRSVKFRHSTSNVSNWAGRGVECLDTRFPLPTLLYAEYNEKLNHDTHKITIDY